MGKMQFSLTNNDIIYMKKTEAPNKIGQPRDMGNVRHKTQNKENQNKTENRHDE